MTCCGWIGLQTPSRRKGAPVLTWNPVTGQALIDCQLDLQEGERIQAQTPRLFTVCKPKQQEIKVNWDQIEGKWTQFKGKAKENWGKLTDDDLDRVAGKRDQLAGKIQEKYGIAKEEADRQLDDWAAKTK